MISNEIKERLLQKNWYVEWKTEQEVNLLLQACDDAGITWNTGQKATEFKPYKHYSVDIGFCKEDKGLTHSATYYKENEIENITDWFFNAIKNNDRKLTPQNKEQEHLVQMLLAIMQDIPVERDFGDGDGWVDAAILYIDLGKKYRIKPTPTPLPISRELWSHIDKKWQYAAMGYCGSILFYERKPTKVGSGWNSFFNVSDCPLNINTDGINWETSLTERPEDV